jgi:hypothetical protein
VKDLAELTLTSLCQIGQATHHKMLHTASLEVEVRLILVNLFLGGGYAYLGSIQNITTSLKFMVHILLSLDLLSGKSIIHCGEHAIRILNALSKDSLS